MTAGARREAARAVFATATAEQAGVPLFAASMLEPGEIIVAVFRPSLAWIALRALPMAVGTGAAAALAWFCLGLWPDSESIARMALQVLAALLAARVAAAVAEWASRVYVLTDRRVLRRRGVLAPTVYSATLNSLRRVELLQDGTDRVLGTGTVTFSSRADGPYDAAWVVVPRARDVHALVEQTRHRYRR